MLINTYYLEKYAEMRQKEMAEAARLEQLIHEVKGQQPKVRSQLTWQVGDWLIGLGHRLKQDTRSRFDPLNLD